MPIRPERAGIGDASRTRLDLHRRTEEITPPSGAPTVVTPTPARLTYDPGIGQGFATSEPHPVAARSKRRRPVLPWRREPLSLYELRARQARRRVRHERRVDVIREAREYVLLATAGVGSIALGLLVWILYALLSGRIDVGTLMGW